MVGPYRGRPVEGRHARVRCESSLSLSLSPDVTAAPATWPSERVLTRRNSALTQLDIDDVDADEEVVIDVAQEAVSVPLHFANQTQLSARADHTSILSRAILQQVGGASL